MSEVKRKGPPRKAEVVKEAVSMGLGDEETLSKLTVAVLKNKIADANLEEDYDIDTMDEIGTKSDNEKPEATIPLKMFPQGAKMEIIEPYNGKDDCEHDYFRKIRIVDPGGNYLVQVCRACGHKERM